ncbi:endonuclease/exonuclease/phosphatase family protein [Pseudoalteromonas sp. NBT06-2]|uniref:endonuclease/exonuclease/phosphatase family protein n=1 Tax=Pseudoalteromonas sp. NBT06-2 TaxID=2025950 RepID=UPI001481DD24|nr:endonuclease/exonuclease/phosphatase family protein [Pseudoalteromonas sp. NBT06-2]
MHKISKVQQFKVATVNLLNYASPPYSYYQLDENYNAEQWQTKNRWLKKQLSRISADVIAFQEVFSFDALAKLTSSLGYQYISKVDEASMAKNCEFTYITPVVAIASKYPITQAQTVFPDNTLLKHLGLPENFSFSRKPIKALIEFPNFGFVRVYVLHLKSKRATNLNDFVDKKVPNYDSYSEALTDTIGRFVSQEQRGLEGMLVFYDALHEQATHPLPSIILGDFNDELHTSALSVIFDHTDVNPKTDHLNFSDAFDISSNIHKTEKPFTLFYEGEGKVLDYILVSNEFNPTNKNTNITDLTYHSLDKHIQLTPLDKHKTNSDHAFIYIQFSVNYS